MKKEIAFWIICPLLFLLAFGFAAPLRGQRGPAFRGEIFAVQFGEYPNGQAFVLVTARIRNTGEPSIVDGFRLVLRLPAGDAVQGKSIVHPETVSAMVDGKDVIVGRSQDALYNKAISTPVVRGGQIVGTLFVEFPGVQRTVLAAGGATLELEFEDVNGQKYTCSQRLSGINSKPLHFPGMSSPRP